LCCPSWEANRKPIGWYNAHKHLEDLHSYCRTWKGKPWLKSLDAFSFHCGMQKVMGSTTSSAFDIKLDPQRHDITMKRGVMLLLVLGMAPWRSSRPGRRQAAAGQAAAPKKAGGKDSDCKWASQFIGQRPSSRVAQKRWKPQPVSSQLWGSPAAANFLWDAHSWHSY
jgi:hypothetical protein